jgi:hypothetical protein
MAAMSDDDFQALLRRLIPVEGQPRDQVAWAQFIEMFEPTIRFHSRVSGGSAPLLQGIIDTQDVVDSVWRRSLGDNWIEKYLLGKSESHVRNYLAVVAENCLRQKIREQQPEQPDGGRRVPFDAAMDAPDLRQEWPDEITASREFVQWCHERLRAMCHNDEEFNSALRLINGETTYAQLAQERMSGKDRLLHERMTREDFDTARSTIETRIARWFKKICNRLGDQIRHEFGEPDDDRPTS